MPLTERYGSNKPAKFRMTLKCNMVGKNANVSLVSGNTVVWGHYCSMGVMGDFV